MQGVRGLACQADMRAGKPEEWSSTCDGNHIAFAEAIDASMAQ